MALNRLIGITFGPDDRDYKLAELEDAITLARKVDAVGIQARVWGEVEVTSKQLIPLPGSLSFDQIETIFDRIKRARLQLELHLTGYFLGILDSEITEVDEAVSYLGQFRKIVGHYVKKSHFVPSFGPKPEEAGRVQTVHVQRDPGIENIIEYLQDKMLSGALKARGEEKEELIAKIRESGSIPEELLQSLLIENHIHPGSSLIRVSQKAQEHSIKTCFDIGHLVRGTLEGSEKVEHYLMSGSSEPILRPEIVQYAKLIDQVQVHWVMPVAGGGYLDHVPPAGAIRPTGVYNVIRLILGHATPTNYIIELRRKYQSPKEVRATAEAFEELLVDAKTDTVSSVGSKP